MKLFDVLGWLGVACVLLAYAMINFDLLQPESIYYLTLNIVGSVGIIASSSQKKDFQPVVLNIIWLGVALIGLVGVIL